MSLRKNGLFKILMVILFMAFVSGGCGGGSSGGSGGNSQGNNGNGNSNGNNGGQSGEINGTWEIVSGHGTTMSDGWTINWTYAPGRIGEIGIEVSKNNYGYGSIYDNFYATTLTGNEVINSGAKGSSWIFIDCTRDDDPDAKVLAVVSFGSLSMLEYIGNGTYQTTEKTYDKLSEVFPNMGNLNIGHFTETLVLEDSDTLRYTYEGKPKEESTTMSGEVSWEIVFKRSGSSYDPNDYNGDNTNTNNNSNGDNNTSPTPSPDNNTSQPDTPPQTNDTWEITSGSWLISQTISGKNYVSHLTYSPKKGDRGLEIDITQNDISTYYGEHVGMFSVTLTGDNVINSGVKGSGALRVSYSVAETPGSEASITFTGGKTFSYIGEGTYRMTTNSGEYDITLVDASTIKWKYTVFSEGWYEIVLTKQQ